MFQTTNQQHVYSKWSQTIWWEYGNRTSSLDQNYYNVVRHGILTIEHHDDDKMIIVVRNLSGFKTLGDCADWDPATTLMSRSAMLKSKTSQPSSMRWFDDILPQWSKCFMSVNKTTKFVGPVESVFILIQTDIANQKKWFVLLPSTEAPSTSENPSTWSSFSCSRIAW